MNNTQRTYKTTYCTCKDIIYIFHFFVLGKKQVRTLLLVLKTSLRKLLMEYWNILSCTVFHWSSWNIRGNSVDICYDKSIWAERFMQTYF